VNRASMARRGDQWDAPLMPGGQRPQAGGDDVAPNARRCLALCSGRLVVCLALSSLGQTATYGDGVTLLRRSTPRRRTRFAGLCSSRPQRTASQLLKSSRAVSGYAFGRSQRCSSARCSGWSGSQTTSAAGSTCTAPGSPRNRCSGATRASWSDTATGGLSCGCPRGAGGAFCNDSTRPDSRSLGATP
jgi:hypothetical protein